MLSEDGLQSAGGCAQQIPEARNVKMIAAFFMGHLGNKVYLRERANAETAENSHTL
jgi:hypothetical protein